MGTKDKIIREHLMSLDFNEKEATPTEIALYLRMKDAMDAYAIGFYEFTRKRFSFKCSKKEAEENFLFFDRVNDGKGTASPEKMLEEFKN